MRLIDTHAHLYLSQFKDDYFEVIDRAVKAGINHIILPNVDESTIASMLDLHKEFPDICIPALAIHPTSVKHNYSEQLDIINYQLNSFSYYYAIGETGIDLYWDSSLFKEQCFVFEKHIEIAIKYKLPLIIHSRNSISEIFNILEKYRDNNLRGVFHCFPGDVEEAHKAIQLGFHIGIGGVVTYKNSKMAKVVENIDLQYMLIETDAPYLSPIPERGKRNESSYLIHIVEKIAQIKNTTQENVASTTTNNAVNLFNINGML